MQPMPQACEGNTSMGVTGRSCYVSVDDYVECTDSECQGNAMVDIEDPRSVIQAGTPICSQCGLSQRHAPISWLSR